MGRSVNGTVFIISPSRSDLLLYGDLLELDGLATVKICDVATAPACLEGCDNSLVLLSFEGWTNEALHLIRSCLRRKLQLKFIGFTSATEIVRLAMTAGCAECIQIPAPIEAVMAAVHRHLDVLLHHESSSPV